MKLYKISFLMIVAAFATASCNDIDEQNPEGGSITAAQSQETNLAITSRTQATFTGMFTMMGQPHGCWPTGRNSSRADDFGFVMQTFSNDLEGADMSSANNEYNWFTSACELSTRNANYANPYIRYVMPYRQIGVANSIIASFPETTTDSSSLNQIAQARAMRAFDYMSLAPYFQFGYAKAADQPCVPILKAGTDYTNNPRATVKEVYEYILEDLNYAIEHLAGYNRGSDKTRIDQHVAYGLRARVNLIMGNYADAASDAAKALQGYTPASISEVSTPTFYNINDHNWIWGVNITPEMVQTENDGYATSASWICSFSGDGYSAATQSYAVINQLLYDKIPATDVRKGWWLDADMHSPLLSTITWGTTTGDDIATLKIKDVKEPMLPYTNVKFGMKAGIGSVTNSNDFPLMRAEEMILIEVEGLAKSGKEGDARTMLENFVKTYRDPSYTIPSSRQFADEIWFQRRVELWGEGFFSADAKRLGKPIVRFHGANTCNFPDAFQFNMAADDGWLNMRFPQTELDNNLGVVNNADGKIPEAGQNPTLRDGVTD